MKNLKYLNGVLTVIAVCLILITMSSLGLIPKATASTVSTRYATVPINTDGSINVHFQQDQVMKVNIVKIDDFTFNSGDVGNTSLPVRVTNSNC